MGGRNPDGSHGFKSHRPGWEMPVHQLLVKQQVSIVFHGHDHMFAREELDGIVYQLVPQPGGRRRGNPRNAEQYGYVHGDVLGGAGFVRVKVAQDEAIVDYVLSVLPGEDAGSRRTARWVIRMRSEAARPGEDCRPVSRDRPVGTGRE